MCESKHLKGVAHQSKKMKYSKTAHALLSRPLLTYSITHCTFLFWRLADAQVKRRHNSLKRGGKKPSGALDDMVGGFLGDEPRSARAGGRSPRSTLAASPSSVLKRCAPRLQ